MQLKDKIQNALDEGRTLVLGAEILVGFDFTAPFQEGFKRLSTVSRYCNLFGLTLMLFTLVLLIAPAPFHQLTERGRDSAGVLSFTSHMVEWALGPFALALGISAYTPAEEIGGRTAGIIFGLGTAVLAIIFWYGPVLLRERRKTGGIGRRSMTSEKELARTPLHDKIRQALTETRVIIPGNQALLGFQFAIILQQGFRELAPWLKWIHLCSLALIAVSTVLLLTPAAYHRIVEDGEDTERFYRVANAMVLFSLPPLALGVCGDFFLVTYKMTEQLAVSVLTVGLMLSIFGGMWFGYTWFRRNHPKNLMRRAA